MSEAQHFREPMRAIYGGGFRCIGPACEENCCQGWGISISETKFQRYTDLPEIAERIGGLSTSLPHQRPAILVRLEPTAVDHARIQLLPNGLCPFLDTDKLCGIQKQYGEGYLPEVCASYPRAEREVFGVTERALHLSCPEAARLVLLDPHLLDQQGPNGASEADRATHRPVSYVDFMVFRKNLSITTEGSIATPTHLHLQVRDLILLLLKDRRYVLWHRLFLLGIFCSRLGQILHEIAPDQHQPTIPESSPVIAELLGDYASLFEAASLRPSLERILPRPEQQLATVLELLQLRLTGQAIQPRLLDCLKRFELGLEHPTASGAVQLRNYTNAAARYYQPLMEQHPYVLENYLANYVFKNRFPFGHGVATSDTESASAELPIAEREYLSLAVHYTLVQGLLIGMSAYHREDFSLHHVVELIQCVSKAIDHNPSFLKTIEMYVVERGLSSHTGIATLVAL